MPSNLGTLITNDYLEGIIIRWEGVSHPEGLGYLIQRYQNLLPGASSAILASNAHENIGTKE
jgi:hypothetical protein